MLYFSIQFCKSKNQGMYFSRGAALVAPRFFVLSENSKRADYIFKKGGKKAFPVKYFSKSCHTLKKPKRDRSGFNAFNI